MATRAVLDKRSRRAACHASSSFSRRNVCHYLRRSCKATFITSLYAGSSKDPRKALEKTLKEVSGLGQTNEFIQLRLSQLKTTHVDLYLIHSPIQTPNIAEAWKVMEDLKAEGKARSIGVSNFRTKDLKAVLEVAKVRTFTFGSKVGIQTPLPYRWSRVSTK